MSYLVFARKYRPQTFAEVVGQRHVTRTLAAAIEADRIAHGYIFSGTRGVGKTTVARIFAKALNCENGPTPTPCNVCQSCLEITKGNAVDVFEIDGASNRGIDDVRDLREQVKYLPQRSRNKIIIIDEVHMLTKEAFNALLKTLEEPPPHVVFMFATTEPDKILDTILSRCQKYDFKAVSVRDLHAHIKMIVDKEGVEYGEDKLALIARKAEGSVRDAMSYLDQAISFAGAECSISDLADLLGIMDRQVLLDLSANILAGQPGKTLEIFDKLSQLAWDVKQFYGDLMEHFRNLIVAKISDNPKTMINASADELEQMVTQAKGQTTETLENLFGILVESEEEITRSTNSRLVLEMVLLRLALAQPVTPLDELAKEIGNLRRALAAGKFSDGPSAGGGGPEGRPKRNDGPPPGDREKKSAAINTAAADAPKETKGAVAETKAPAAKSEAVARDRKGLIAAVRKSDMQLSSALDRGVITIEGNHVSILVQPGFDVDVVNSGKETLQKIVKEVFGESTTVQTTEIAASSINNESEIARDKKQVVRQRREEARQKILKDPTVGALLKQFPGAEVKVIPSRS
jgi:DNA polymerase III subunit gamma/tau